MSVTLGPSTAANSLTVNFDAIFATSLANARKTLADNISNSNPFFYEMKKNGMYEGADGGAYLQEDLMYALTPTDSYDSFDTLIIAPPDGITAAIYDWRQNSTPIPVSNKEKKMNKHRLVDFLAARIKQAELGAIDWWSKSILQGSLPTGGNIYTPRVSTFNGSAAVDPLWAFVQPDPTVAGQTYSKIGGIDQSVAANSWWRNRVVDFSGVTTYSGFLAKLDNLFNTMSIGPGGKPNLLLCDQTTYELINAAYYDKYRRTADSDNDYPFPNIKFRGAKIVWDENFPNIFANTTDTTTANGGAILALNTDFLKIRYESSTDFVTTDMVRPANQDAEVAHILWMGNITCSNRRKQGIGWKIPRTLVTG
jgi:hypothetical protein